jgi:HK97 family phage major capsid protein
MLGGDGTVETKDRGRIKELTKALETKAAQIDTIAASFKDETGNGQFVVSKEQVDDYRTAVGEAEQIKALIEAEEGAGRINAFLGSAAGTGPVAGQEAAAYGRTSGKSLGRMWLESDQYGEMKSTGFDPNKFPGAFESGMGLRALENGGMQTKDIYSSMAGNISIPALGTPQNVGLVPRQLRPGRVRDLFPQDTTTANLLYGIRETGFVNNAAVVPERTSSTGGPATGAASDIFGLKPQSNLTVVPVTYPVSTIAHYMNVHKNTLADEPRMQGLIDRDLMDGVKLTEDWEIMFGPGGGDAMTGICNTPGIQVYTGTGGDPQTAQIRRAITRVTLAYFQPSGVVLHPLDWESLELERDSYGQYRLAVSVAMGAQKVVWRLDVVDTVAINQGHYLLGAFGLGAKLYDRETVNIAISTENSDNFIRNTVTLRCEERLVLEVSRPESFVIGTLV